jgi:hypothetical protein
MFSQRKRRLFLGLGLAVALALAVSPASASAVSTLTGESLSGSSSSGNSRTCPTPTYSVSGTATVPYPGTFTESGTWTIQGSDPFSATFTITSGANTITGTKSAEILTTPGVSFTDVGCVNVGADPAAAHLTGVPYTATIHTPSGSFHDEGTSVVDVDITESGAATLTESFVSSLAQPVPLAPTSKDQCKNNGWKNFPQFKNQGECVSFAVSHSQT